MAALWLRRNGRSVAMWWGAALLGILLSALGWVAV
jgi:hypothetical protein